jgi:predicted  nucleic acid-binding Zn-ribbon protein
MNNQEQFEQLIDQNRQLLARIARLEKRFDTLENGLTRLVKSNREYDAAHARHVELARTELHNALERIVNLELKVFPNLAGDIDCLHNIIGDGDANHQAHNQLDRRKP